MCHYSGASLCADGMKLFEDFLKSEFSDENIHFWKACERYKTLPEPTLEKEAKAIFSEYIAPHAPKMVSLSRVLPPPLGASNKSTAPHSLYQ